MKKITIAVESKWKPKNPDLSIMIRHVIKIDDKFQNKINKLNKNLIWEKYRISHINSEDLAKVENRRKSNTHAKSHSVFHLKILTSSLLFKTQLNDLQSSIIEPAYMLLSSSRLSIKSTRLPVQESSESQHLQATSKRCGTFATRQRRNLENPNTLPSIEDIVT